ncbi:MAG TPA: methyltransferase domain-containing protein [Candidatus Humimicrobiaceae bacterium]|nr:methyltransferase domain-containing protein [Candidatus Humimicrobiaceae bacterium]
MEREYAEYLLEKTKEDYNLIAEDFSRTRWNIWSEFNIFRDFIKEGDKILDVGCGNGRLLKILKDKKIKYTGVDVSEKLLEIAKKRYPQNNFLVADNLNLPFLDNNFDKVFSVAVLHTIPSEDLRKKAISELKRVLKPGGLLFITVWDLWRKDTFLLLLKYSFLKLIGKSKLDFGDALVPWSTKTKRFYHFFTKKELRSLVEITGFSIVKRGVSKNEAGSRSNIYLIAEK